MKLAIKAFEKRKVNKSLLTKINGGSTIKEVGEGQSATARKS